MGDIMIPSDSEIRLDFTLKVDHILKVEIPPGGTKVELVPQGGWLAWLQQGRKPSRLFRDQRFDIWTSTRFKMKMECQYSVGNTCGLQNTTGTHRVPVDVRVSLPSALTDAAGRPVSRRPLLLDGSETDMFQPSHYVDHKPGSLHFEIQKDSVEEMLTYDADKYSGNITVIWDSEV
ncbi:hypothetical protein [Pseudomonas brassicacearum]|nr:hypothetical protein [Pseudomonas brassicacearum]